MSLPQKGAADEVADAAADGADEAEAEEEPQGNPPTEYITLNPNAEPLRLESLCMNCRENVRARGRLPRCKRAATDAAAAARRARPRC
jgi:hypothetical protein